MPRYDLPACGYVFDVSVTFGHTQHLGLGFEPIVKSVAGGVPSFFVQLISAFANPVFQFTKAHLAEIEVGGAELNLHDVHLVFRIYLRSSSSMSLLMRVAALENQRLGRSR
jgi:hypothetical protein